MMNQAWIELKKKKFANVIMIVLQWAWLAHHWRFGASSESKVETHRLEVLGLADETEWVGEEREAEQRKQRIWVL